MGNIGQKAQQIQNLREGLLFSPKLIEYGVLKLSIRTTEAEIDNRLQAELPIDLSLAEVLFCFLSERVGSSISPSSISSSLKLPPTTITSRLRRLEGLGLVRRETTEADRRSLTAQVTEEGERTLVAAVKIYASVVEESFSSPVNVSIAEKLESDN